MSQDATNATVVYRQDLNPTLRIVRIRPDSGRVPLFKPGQFVTIGLPKALPSEQAGKLPAGRVPMTKRAYSIASSPKQTDSLELFIVLIEEGKLTPQLWLPDFGQRVWMDERIKGEFTLDPVPPGKDLVMISTGTGIAPFVSMLRTDHGTGRWRRFAMINGVRQVSDLGYRDELEDLARRDPTFRYLPVVSRATPADGWRGLHGRVTMLLDPERFAEFAGFPLDPARAHVFLCGNPAMIDETEMRLVERGFRTHTREQVGSIHFERYW